MGVIYEWQQEIDACHMFLSLPPGVGKHELAIKIAPRHLSVGVKGNTPFLDEDIFSLVDLDCSFWMIEDGELHIELGKAHKGETWQCALMGHGKLDMFTEQEVNKQIMLERFQEEHPGFDFSGASFSGQAPAARTFMGGVADLFSFQSASRCGAFSFRRNLNLPLFQTQKK